MLHIIDNMNVYVFFVSIIYPGIVAVLTYRLLVPRIVEWKSITIEATFYGTFTFILTRPLTAYILSSIENKTTSYYVIFFIITVVPIVLSIALFKIREWRFICKHICEQSPSAWDFLFSQKKPYFIKVHLDNGEQVAGYFGPLSCANSSSYNGDIYIQWAYKLCDDNSIGEVVHLSKGIYIRKESIKYLELLNTKEEP